MKNVNQSLEWPYERVCPECGRTFCVRSLDAWIYRDGAELLCRWGCMMRRERRKEEERMKSTKEEERRQRNMQLTPRQKEGVVRWYVRRGMTNQQIGEETGFSAQLVNHYRRKIEKEAGTE